MEYVYDNDNYYVERTPLYDGYNIVNKVTGVQEGREKALPDACIMAAHYDYAIRNKIWEGQISVLEVDPGSLRAFDS